MKKLLIAATILLIFTGCSSKEETKKEEQKLVTNLELRYVSDGVVDGSIKTTIYNDNDVKKSVESYTITITTDGEHTDIFNITSTINKEIEPHSYIEITTPIGFEVGTVTNIEYNVQNND